MKNLDLNSYGVQEMNAQEINNVDGGSLKGAIVGACFGSSGGPGCALLGAAIGALFF